MSFRATLHAVLENKIFTVLSLDFDVSCHIWWTDTDPKSLSIFFPEIPVALVHDITSPDSSCLQLNENTHSSLTSCTACQGENYSFTCRGHSHLFFSGPSCDGLWLASNMSILMSSPQTPQAQASSMAIHVHHLTQPDFSIWRAESLKYPPYSRRTYCIKCIYEMYALEGQGKKPNSWHNIPKARREAAPWVHSLTVQRLYSTTL